MSREEGVRKEPGGHCAERSGDLERGVSSGFGGSGIVEGYRKGRRGTREQESKRRRRRKGRMRRKKMSDDQVPSSKAE